MAPRSESAPTPSLGCDHPDSRGKSNGQDGKKYPANVEARVRDQVPEDDRNQEATYGGEGEHETRRCADVVFDTADSWGTDSQAAKQRMRKKPIPMPSGQRAQIEAGTTGISASKAPTTRSGPITKSSVGHGRGIRTGRRFVCSRRVNNDQGVRPSMKELRRYSGGHETPEYATVTAPHHNGFSTMLLATRIIAPAGWPARTSKLHPIFNESKVATLSA